MAEERYARGWAEDAGYECHVGVEFKENWEVAELASEIRQVCRHALARYSTHLEIVRYVKTWITGEYPGRAYFIETDLGGCGVQVYDPMDFVKSRDPATRPESPN